MLQLVYIVGGWGVSKTTLQLRGRCIKSLRQRSFNWQSTAFVMRGLWVQIPPLALGIRSWCVLAGFSQNSFGNAAPCQNFGQSGSIYSRTAVFFGP